MPGRYTKKPVTIEAVQWTRDNMYEIIEFSEGSDDFGFNADTVTIHTLEGSMVASPGDWIIKGVQGEFYPCKPDIFAATYDEAATDGLNFGQAIEAAKKGRKIARRGWNGKNMFVVYMPPLRLPPHNAQEPGAKVNDRTAKWIGEDQPLDCQPYFAMYNAQKQWIPGWLASQSDMLADDWQTVD